MISILLYLQLTHEDLNLKCSECTTEFKNHNLLRRHFAQVHQDIIPCSLCGKRIKKARILPQKMDPEAVASGMCMLHICRSFFRKELMAACTMCQSVSQSGWGCVCGGVKCLVHTLFSFVCKSIYPMDPHCQMISRTIFQ